jgi:hypothetical protein
MCVDIAMMWQKASIHRSGPLVGKHFVPFSRSGDMGNDVTTTNIHRQNAILKTTKQRVVANLNDIDMLTEMEISDLCLRCEKHFLSYTDLSGDPVFSSIEAT